LTGKLRNIFIGSPKDIRESGIFHKLALVPFLAWIGLGADGLSSSSYGPEEAFRTLGEHTYLAVGIALLTSLTVFLIAAAYSRLIESFPQGGGYVVATRTLGGSAGVVSGCALLVDYVLTIAVSIAAAWDALFSFLPFSPEIWKMPLVLGTVTFLILVNIRGVKESVLLMAPIFIVFLLTHAFLIGYGILSHFGEVHTTAERITSGWESGLITLGGGGMLLLFLHAFSMGGGTYTGLEAVSNSLSIMREPRVKTAQKTMDYMAVSLAITAGGLLLCYLLWQVKVVEGKTLNAVLLEGVSAGFPFGNLFLIIALISEGALLIVAAQAGFLGGPRVLSSMSADSWLPHRFTSLSDRLTMGNGISLMGISAIAVLIYSRGDVHQLVVMYSINVFLTFSLSMAGMLRYLYKHRLITPDWKRRSILFVITLLFCILILTVTVFEKFTEGGWLTLVVTGSLIAICFLIRRHYDSFSQKIQRFTDELVDLTNIKPRDVGIPQSDKTVAGLFVDGYNGVGVHSLLTILTQFRDQLGGVVFLSAGHVDSSRFKGEGAVHDLQFDVEYDCRRYVEYAHKLGIPATYRAAVGVDVVDELDMLCKKVAMEYPKVLFFASQIIFHKPKWYHGFLHNQTAFAIQQKLIWSGYKLVIWPTRVA
jgi:amino acid transporter